MQETALPRRRGGVGWQIGGELRDREIGASVVRAGQSSLAFTKGSYYYVR
jgi:hypothetical protein